MVSAKLNYKYSELKNNPYFIFFPFLIFFIVFVIKQHNDVMEGDENAYVVFAQNLLSGFYSPPAPNIDLWYGPGYPVLLIPFVAFGAPLICITLLNAIFQYLSIIFLFKAIKMLVTVQIALIFSLAWALCYSSYFYMGLIITETFTLFLISLLIFCVVKAFEDKQYKFCYLAGFILGYVALTKVIFGYVLLVLLLGSIFLWIANRRALYYQKSVLIMLIALITISPYLIYTYNLTNRMFYFGNSGGMSLYWMSTPFENEYGDWNNESFTSNKIDGKLSNSKNFLEMTHQKDIDRILKFKGVEKDDEYRKIAIQNILTYPSKYMKNVMHNISRALFGFPLTYNYQRPLMKIWYFAILYTLMLIAIFPTLKNWRKIPFSLRFIFMLALIYLAGSSLLSGDNRQFLVAVPIFIFWIAYIFHKSLSFKITFNENKGL
jgi:4-amino-4-deoxy-L-arabinose transferase-like glycosyltransferase